MPEIAGIFTPDWGAMHARAVIASVNSARLTAVLCFGLLLALNPLPLRAAASTEPADIAALRASQVRSASDLRLQAMHLREITPDRRHRAWAALALAEFENDLENADASLAMLDEAQREADALTLPDLKFQALGVRSVDQFNQPAVSFTLKPLPVPRLAKMGLPASSFSIALMWASARSSTWM